MDKAKLIHADYDDAVSALLAVRELLTRTGSKRDRLDAIDGVVQAFIDKASGVQS